MSFIGTLSSLANSRKGDLHPIWRYFGADEPNYAYMKDGRKLLGRLGELAPKEVYVRTHNLGHDRLRRGQTRDSGFSWLLGFGRGHRPDFVLQLSAHLSRFLII